MKTIDCRGLACPQPVINTKKALDMGARTLEIITDNVVSRENVLKFARSQGCFASFTDDNGIYRIIVTRADTLPSTLLEAVASLPVLGNLTLYLITSDEFGRGGAELGMALMKTFFYALSESGVQNNHLVFVNAGVKLVCESSPVLESIRKLTEVGWDIKACGTCLNYYGLKEKLVLGEITNMYNIVELVEQSGKVVTL
ncbi:MAG: SirA family protein [Bacillota bacterium]|nr:MAG: SirA family protein [Bacillota bacterium]MBS3949329.1 sulfurtransferase-like selenium metabolism protein YedF [Peptococcaceae bacterium]